MTTFAEITSGQRDAESPFDTTLANQYANNHLAVIEGDPTAAAHRIQTDAYDDLSITNQKVGDAQLGAEKLQTGADERTWVLARLSSSAVGAVGTYAMLYSSTPRAPGNGVAGSSLIYSEGDASTVGGNPGGNWRCMGSIQSSGATTWLRYS